MSEIEWLYQPFVYGLCLGMRRRKGMKNLIKLIALTLLLCVYACNNKEEGPELLEAEILGQDFTRWVCGGGWRIRLNDEIIFVHELPNERVGAIVSGDGFTEQSPLPVYIRLNPNPTSACATQFEGQKELSFLSLRD